MGELGVMFGCLGIAVLGVPIWALVEALRARRVLDRQRLELESISGRLQRLERRLFGAPAAEMAEEPVAAAPVPDILEPPVPAEPLPPQPLETQPPPAEQEPEPGVPPPSVILPPATPKTPFDWEGLIGVRLFAWLGGIALFLGAALFLQYGIQHGLITPPMRVAIGLVVGAAALAVGDAIRARANWAGQATSGAGIAVLYATLYAARSLYDLIPIGVALLGMALVTAVASLLAVRRNTFVLAVLGLIGGFATPLLLPTVEDRALALLVYTILLVVGLLAVARVRGWTSLRFFSLIGTGLLFMLWAQANLDPFEVPWALGATVVLSALFLFLPGKESGSESDEDLSKGTLALAAMAPFLVPVALAPHPTLAPSPMLLVGHFLVLLVGSAWISRKSRFAGLLPVAAALSLAGVVFRSRADLFPSERETTLALFAILPVALVVFWWMDRSEKSERYSRLAAAVFPAGSVLIVARIVEFEPRGEPVLATWLFALFHTGILLAISARQRSGGWAIGAQAQHLIAVALLTLRFESGRLQEYLPLVLAPLFLFWALPFLSERFRSDRLGWFSSAVAPLAHFPLLYAFAKPVWGEGPMGGAAIGVALLAMTSLWQASRLARTGEDRQLIRALFGAVALLFATAAIPILLDRQWITIAFALEAAALAWLATRVEVRGLLPATVALGAGAFVRLVFNAALWSYQPRSGTPIFNWYLYTFGVPALAFLAAAWWLSRVEAARERRLPGVFRAAAGVLLFLLLNVEIADFYSSGDALTFRLTGERLAEDMTYSLAWGVFALILLAIGITKASRPTRAAALGVLVLTIGKVFLHDLWRLGALYRVGSIVGLAVALLAVSFLTQRFVFDRGKR